MQQTDYVPPPHRPRFARSRQLVHELLRQHPGGLTSKQLRLHTGLSKGGMFGALEALTDEGIVVRERTEVYSYTPYVYRLREVVQ